MLIFNVSICEKNIFHMLKNINMLNINVMHSIVERVTPMVNNRLSYLSIFLYFSLQKQNSLFLYYNKVKKNIYVWWTILSFCSHYCRCRKSSRINTVKNPSCFIINTIYFRHPSCRSKKYSEKTNNIHYNPSFDLKKEIQIAQTFVSNRILTLPYQSLE